MDGTYYKPRQIRNVKIKSKSPKTKINFSNFIDMNFITNIFKLLFCSKGSRIIDPCLPKDFTDEGMFKKRHYYLKGTGRFRACQNDLITLLNTTAACKRKPCSLNGVHQPSINFRNSEFYGFAEFWYSTQDVLRMGASYEGDKMDQMALVSVTLLFLIHFIFLLHSPVLLMFSIFLYILAHQNSLTRVLNLTFLLGGF